MKRNTLELLYALICENGIYGKYVPLLLSCSRELGGDLSVDRYKFIELSGLSRQKFHKVINRYIKTGLIRKKGWNNYVFEEEKIKV